MLLMLLLLPAMGLATGDSQDASIKPLLSAGLRKRLDETTATAEAALCNQTIGEEPCKMAKKWWRNMGHSGQVEAEIMLLNTLAQDPGVRTVCEVGFNAGHAAVAMLHGTKTNLVEFDLLALPYSLAAKAAIEFVYPGRSRFFEGRSQITIPLYAARVALDPANHPPCDLWMVDGDHWKGALLDMRAAVNASRNGAIVVADDCCSRAPDVQKAWKSMTAPDGHIVEDYVKVVHLPSPAGTKGWCVGRAVRRDDDVAKLNRGFERAHTLMIDPVSRSGFMAREAQRAVAKAASGVQHTIG